MVTDPTIIGAAIDYHTKGLTPIPVAPDGTKRPLITTWTQWQDTQPDLQQTLAWFTTVDADGLGILTGGPAHREVMEFEGRAIAEGFLELYTDACEAARIGELWLRVRSGYVTQSPSYGQHNHLTVIGECARNTKLAQRPSTPAELEAWKQAERAKLPDIADETLRSRRAQKIDETTADQVRQVLIETRGQGGFIVMPPSHGRTHATGNAWTVLIGSAGDAAVVTQAERDALHDVARSLDQMPTNPKQPIGFEVEAAPRQADNQRPGDDFNIRATWDEILIPHGWTKAGTRGKETLWTRPGKSVRDGISATTGHANDGDRLFVFSSSTEFVPEKPYTKFAAYALLEHAGDYRIAARRLASEGWGSGPADTESRTLTMTGGANVYPFPVRQTTGVPVVDGTADTLERLVNRLAQDELIRLRARARAKELYALESSPEAEPFDLGSLAEVLARPADPPRRVGGLIPWSASTLLIAQRKAGKTTFELNIAKALLTGEELLGAFPVIPAKGSVAVFNYEVSGRQFATWAQECGIPEDRLILVNLRGCRNPLADQRDAKRLAAELKARQVESVIVDPFGRAYTGQSQNDAGEVGSWLVRLDQFVRGDVGALDLILSAHAGWNGERTRGSSALEDWADVLINITRGHGDDERDSPDRYFRAEGRDVDIPEDMLTYCQETRTLTLSGNGGRRKVREVKRSQGLTGPVMELINANPGITYKEIVRRMREALGGVRDADVSAAIRYLVDASQAYRADAPNGKPKPIYPGQQPLTVVR